MLIDDPVFARALETLSSVINLSTGVGIRVIGRWRTMSYAFSEPRDTPTNPRTSSLGSFGVDGGLKTPRILKRWPGRYRP